MNIRVRNTLRQTKRILILISTVQVFFFLFNLSLSILQGSVIEKSIKSPNLSMLYNAIPPKIPAPITIDNIDNIRYKLYLYCFLKVVFLSYIIIPQKGQPIKDCPLSVKLLLCSLSS